MTSYSSGKEITITNIHQKKPGVVEEYVEWTGEI
jgi:hypothetical protein